MEDRLSLVLFAVIISIFPMNSAEVKQTDSGAIMQLTYQPERDDSEPEYERSCFQVVICLRETFPKIAQKTDNCLLFNHTLLKDKCQWLKDKTFHAKIPSPVPHDYTLELRFDDDPELTKYMDFKTQSDGNISNYSITWDNFTNILFEFKINCIENYYGETCETYCKSIPGNFTCDQDGRIKCVPGLRGRYCELEDSCFYEPCAPNAACINNKNGRGRICLCKSNLSEQCYVKHDPCIRKPCQNHGTCTYSGQYSATYECICTFGWTGPWCHKRISKCKDLEAAESIRMQVNVTEVEETQPHKMSSTAVCLNGGTCYDHKDELHFLCICPPGWTGERCESAVNYKKDVSRHFLWSILICFIPAAVIFALLYRIRHLRLLLRYSNMPSKSVNYTEDHQITNIYAKMNSPEIRILPSYPNGSCQTNPNKCDSVTDNENLKQSLDVYEECYPVDRGTLNLLPSHYEIIDVQEYEEIGPSLPARTFGMLPMEGVNETARRKEDSLQIRRK